MYDHAYAYMHAYMHACMYAQVALEWSRLALSEGGLPVAGLELWGSVEAAESSIENSRLEALA